MQGTGRQRRRWPVLRVLVSCCPVPGPLLLDDHSHGACHAIIPFMGSMLALLTLGGHPYHQQSAAVQTQQAAVQPSSEDRRWTPPCCQERFSLLEADGSAKGDYLHHVCGLQGQTCYAMAAADVASICRDLSVWAVAMHQVCAT